MKAFCRVCLATLAAFVAMLGAACATSDPSVSPRWAVMKAADTVEPVVREVTTLVAAGVVSDNTADDIAQYGPTVQRLASAYFDGAEACVVLNGQLTTDASAGRQCAPSTLVAVYESLDGEIINWMIAASEAGDNQAAAIIGAARLVVSLVPKPVTGGLLAGYRDEPDVPLELFKARRAMLRAMFEQLISAAASRAKRVS